MFSYFCKVGWKDKVESTAFIKFQEEKSRRSRATLMCPFIKISSSLTGHMAARCPSLLRSYVCCSRRGARCLATQSQKPKNDLSSRTNLTSLPEETWLTRRVEASAVTRKLFLAVTNLLGYGSAKQVAGRRTFAIYEQIAARAPDKEREFWQQGTSF